MRFKRTAFNEYRNRKGFLWFPKGKNGTEGYRWLEYAYWGESFIGGRWRFDWWLEKESE